MRCSRKKRELRREIHNEANTKEEELKSARKRGISFLHIKVRKKIFSKMDRLGRRKKARTGCRFYREKEC